MTLMDHALEYCDRGFSVIPLRSRDKKPLLKSWAEYQSCPATREEITVWWTANLDANIGIICGKVSGIIVVDVDGDQTDWHDITNAAPTGLIAKTPRGYHFYYQYKETPIKTCAGILPGVDVRSDGGYVVVAPSIHPTGVPYSWCATEDLGEISPELENLLMPKRSTKAVQTSPKGDDKWLSELLQGVNQGSRNASAARYAGYLKGKGHRIDVVMGMMTSWNRQNQPPLDGPELNRVVNSIFKMPSVCGEPAWPKEPTDVSGIEKRIKGISQSIDRTELFRQLEPILADLSTLPDALAQALMESVKKRFGLKQEEVKGYLRDINRLRREREKTERQVNCERDDDEEYTANFEMLVDIVDDEGAPAFLVKDGDTLAVKKSVKIDGIVKLPPPRDQMLWLLPRSVEVLRYYSEDSDAKLYDDLILYLTGISELPSRLHYDLCALWALHTWLMENFSYSPILCFYSVAEKGKTRTGEGLTYISYRGMPTVSLREAYILRMANNFGGTLFFDVMSIWKKAEKNGCEDILLQRYERGACVPRVNRPEAGAFQDTDYYSVFGATLIATNENAHRILETRCVQINMQSSSKWFENDVTPKDSLPMKERLCAFRARHLGRSIPAADKPSRGRLGDILKPLLQITRLVRPEREDEFMHLIKELENDRCNDKSETLDAVVLRAMHEIRYKAVNGYVSVGAITEHINAERPEKDSLTPHRIGHKLKALGFSKGASNTGGAAYLINEPLLMRLLAEYGVLEISEISEMPAHPSSIVHDSKEDMA